MDEMDTLKERKQANARLALLAVAPIASILFALFSLFGNEVWRMLLLGFSGFLGTISLIAGVVTLIFQIARNRLVVRNAAPSNPGKETLKSPGSLFSLLPLYTAEEKKDFNPCMNWFSRVFNLDMSSVKCFSAISAASPIPAMETIFSVPARSWRS